MHKCSSVAVFNPVGFKPDEVLPAELKKFSDDARYFVFKIYEQRIFNFRDKSDFIPIKCEYIRKIISERNYRKIREALVKAGVVETDNQWIKGQKCIGYRLRGDYLSQPFERYILTSRRLVRNIQKTQVKSEAEISLDVHKFLYRNLQDIRIDYLPAVKSLTNEDFYLNKTSIELLHEKQWFFKADKYGRVHTNLTNLKSSLRKYLNVKGEELVEVDIANSQPLFLSIIASTYIKYGTLVSFNSPPSFPSLRCDILPDLLLYKDLVTQGKLYFWLSNKFKLRTKSRKRLKVKMFSELFFGKNHETRLCRKFAEVFPSVFRVVQQVKQKDYAALARLLQKVESSFVINKVVRRMMETDRYVATIHDSFLVKPHDIEVLNFFIQQEFGQWDHNPTLSVKTLSKAVCN